MFTDAAVTADQSPPGQRVDLGWRIGDTWTSPTWAILIDGAAVDLTDDGWSATAVVRRAGDIACEWTTEPGGGDVALGTAIVDLGDGRQVTTSTVTLSHTVAQSRATRPFTRLPFELQVARAGEAWTVLYGRATAWPEVAR